MVCPQCGTDNKPGARLCEFCQAVLSSGQPVGGPGSRSPAIEAERKRAEAEARLRRRRTTEHVVVPILAATGIVLLVLIVVFFPRKPSERPDVAAQYPVAALNKYLGALQKGDYTTAYAMLAAPLQQKVTEEQFAAFYTQNPALKVTSHSVKDTGDFDAQNGYAALSVNDSPEFWTYTKEPEGWRITWCPAFETLFGIPSPA